MLATCSMNSLSREKENNQFTLSNLSLHLEEPQPGLPHQPTQEEDSLLLKNLVWAKTGLLVEPPTLPERSSRRTHNTVDTIQRCTSNHQATSGPIHTMILMIKSSISETEPMLNQTETPELWPSIRLTIPTDKPGPTLMMEPPTKVEAQSTLSEICKPLEDQIHPDKTLPPPDLHEHNM